MKKGESRESHHIHPLHPAKQTAARAPGRGAPAALLTLPEKKQSGLNRNGSPAKKWPLTGSQAQTRHRHSHARQTHRATPTKARNAASVMQNGKKSCLLAGDCAISIPQGAARAGRPRPPCVQPGASAAARRQVGLAGRHALRAALAQGSSRDRYNRIPEARRRAAGVREEGASSSSPTRQATTRSSTAP